VRAKKGDVWCSGRPPSILRAKRARCLPGAIGHFGVDLVDLYNIEIYLYCLRLEFLFRSPGRSAPFTPRDFLNHNVEIEVTLTALGNIDRDSPGNYL